MPAGATAIEMADPGGLLARDQRGPRVRGDRPMRSHTDDPEGRYGQGQTHQRGDKANLNGTWRSRGPRPRRRRRNGVGSLMFGKSHRKVVIGQRRHQLQVSWF